MTNRIASAWARLPAHVSTSLGFVVRGVALAGGLLVATAGAAGAVTLLDRLAPAFLAVRDGDVTAMVGAQLRVLLQLSIEMDALLRGLFG